MHFRNLWDLLFLFFSFFFWSHSLCIILMLFLALGTEEIWKKPFKTYSSNYLGNEFVVWFKVVAIFKAKLSNSACGYQWDDLRRSREGWVKKCITSFSSSSLSSPPSCFSWEHCLIHHFNTNFFPKSISGELNLRQMVRMIQNSRAYMLKNVIIENKKLKCINIHHLALKG